MKNRLMMLVIVLLCLCMCFAACKPTTPEDTTKTIITVLKDTKANENVITKGVVFAKVDTGYLVSDATAAILVVDTASQVSVGDELSISGKLLLSSDGVPSIGEATVTVLSQGNTTLLPTASSLKDVASIIKSRGNYYKYLNINGVVSNTGDIHTLELDGKSVILDSVHTDLNLFDQWIGRKISIDIILTGYNAGWLASYVGDADGITAYKADLEQIKEQIFSDVQQQLVSEVYLNLTLPTEYRLEPDVQFVWTVTQGQSAVAIADNIATVTTSTADIAVKIKLTLSVDSTSVSQEFDLVVKAVEDTTIEEAMLTSGSVCGVKGQVITKGIIQTGEVHSVIIKDQANATLMVNLSRAQYNGYAMGDTIRVVGKYSPSTGEATSMSVFAALDSTLVEAASADYTIDYSQLEAITLSQDSEYISATGDYQGLNGKLFKIVNPYMGYSGNTTYNFVRFGANKDSLTANGYVYTEGDVITKRIFCFAINALYENGLTDIDQYWNIPTLAEGGRQYQYTIYAYAMYAGGDTWQFVIPSEQAIVGTPSYAEMLAKSEIDEFVTDGNIYANQAGSLTLPSSTASLSSIVWSADKDIINVATGAYEAVTEETVVTLTATYILNGVQGKCIVVLTFKSNAKPAPMNLTQAIENADIVEEINATVVGYASTSNNSAEQRNGLIVTDGINVVWLQNTVYEVGGVEIQVGDMLLIKVKTFVVNDASRILEAEEGGITIVSRGNSVNYTNLAVANTIDGEDAMVEYAGQANNKQGYVVKFSGVFYLIGTGSSNCRYQIHFKGDDVTGSAGARYTYPDSTNKTLSFSSAGNRLQMGEWWAEAGIPENSSGTSYAVKGTIYAIGSGMGATMHAYSIFMVEDSSLAEPIEFYADREIKSLFRDEYPATTAGTITLPTSVEHSGHIVWSVNNSNLFDVTTGQYSAVTADTVIAITASYNIGGVALTTTVNVTLKAEPKQPALTLAQALTLAEDKTSQEIDEVELMVAGYAGSPENSVSYCEGYILTDGVSTVWYKLAAFAPTATDFVVGDKVNIVGCTLTNTQAIRVMEGGVATKVSDNNIIDYSSLALSATITSEEEMIAFATRTDARQGYIIKITGDFSMVGLSSTSEQSRYQINFKNAANSADSRYLFDSGKSQSLVISFSATAHLYADKINPITKVELTPADGATTATYVPALSGSKCYMFSGTMYLVGGKNSGKTLYSWSIINADGLSLMSREV